jgi:NAD+ kinase
VNPEINIKQVVVLTHGDPGVARDPLRQALSLLKAEGVRLLAPHAEWEKHDGILDESGVEQLTSASQLNSVDLCLVLGGDGTMLRAFHLTRDRCIPVAGVNLGRVGFLTTIDPSELEDGMRRLLAHDFKEYPLLGLEASVGRDLYRATNDVFVGRGKRSHACALALTINGVTLFEVLCDGVVVGTPAGSSAYSLAAGGPLLGISVNAYVISLVAPHAVGVRPVVAAPGDVLEIINIDDVEASVDIDGDRVAALEPGATVRINSSPGMTTLALLGGDSLYHHFRDRLL